MLHSANEPISLFFVSWKLGADDSDYGEAVGYFMYIDGRFCWDSLVTSPTIEKIVPASLQESHARALEKETPLSGTPLKMDPSMTAPKIKSSVPPSYSEAARRAKLEGTVKLSLVVDIDGHPKQIKVVQSLGGGLDEEAVKSVRQFRFTPAIKDGKPVPIQINMEENFQLY